jgi:hypothetical protein
VSKSYYTKNSQKEKQPNWSRPAQRSIVQDLLSLLIAPRPSQPASIDIATVTFPRTCYNIIFLFSTGNGRRWASSDYSFSRPQFRDTLASKQAELLAWCIYFFFLFRGDIYTPTCTHCHLLLACVSPGPLFSVCRRRCVVHCNLGKKKNISERRKRTRVTHTYTHTSVIYNQFPFIFFYFSVV